MAFKRACLLAALFFLVLTISRPGRGQSNVSSSVKAQYASLVHLASKNPDAPLSEPSGSDRCIVCHRTEVEGYARSAMAHSLRKAGNEPDGTVKTPDTTITMHSSSTGYWQTLQSGGETSNYRIDYVIGSGNHAAGYLLDLDGHLFQSPVAYYKNRRAYDLAPGYEGKPNPDFTRPVVEGCVFCHSGSPLHIEGTTNQYRTPPFSAEAITCERCHGPAEEHLKDPRAGNIVNPAKLDHAARDSVCEQCHLLGVARILNPGKNFSDFQVGQPLENAFTIYCNAVPPGSAAGQIKVISHVEQLARSMCVRKSDGQMWCGTCHDPHDKPLDPVSYYRNKCLMCHTGNFASAHPNKTSNCIGCHMPRRNAKDGGHTAFTDHRIQRRPETQPDLPDDLDIAAWREPTQELQERNLGIAYINVGTDRRSAPFIGRGYRMLTEVQNQFSNDSEVFMAMGNALQMAKQTSEAEFAFERVLQLDPNSVVGETKAASVSLEAGDINTAVSRLERAVQLDPLHLPAVSTLLDLYKQQGNLDKAQQLSLRVTAMMDSNATPTLTPASQKKFEGAFQNVRVLKDLSSDDLISEMQFIDASLGVKCNYCHDEKHYESDDKKPKQTARDMMRMVIMLNKNSFKGERFVTCYSCHKGKIHTEGAPTVFPGVHEQASETEPLPTNLPTVDQILDNYIHALGGADAIERITSREIKGTTTLDGKSVSVEGFDRTPDMLEWVWRTPKGDRVTVLHGREGWLKTPDRKVRDIEGAKLEAVEMAADLHFPLHMKQAFDELKLEYPEKVNGRDAYVLSMKKIGEEPLKFYFDESTGLLLRVLRYDGSPLGDSPVQIDYSDYRNADGVQVPFHRVIARANGDVSIQWQHIQQNVSIDDVRFLKPTASESKAKSSM
jgi:photosynthetic reaction center cytochrome c subunit